MFGPSFFLPLKILQVFLIGRDLSHGKQRAFHIIQQFDAVQFFIDKENINHIPLASVHAHIGTVIILRVEDAFCRRPFHPRIIHLPFLKICMYGSPANLVKQSLVGLVDDHAIIKNLQHLWLLLLREHINGITGYLRFIAPENWLAVHPEYRILR